MAETSLVEAAQAGDRGAFTELLRPLERPLRSYLYRLCADPDVAQDLYQEAVLRAFEQIGTLRESASFRSWLFRIATNAALDHHRGRQRFSPDAQDRARTASLFDPTFHPTIEEFVEFVASTPETRYEIREHVDFCFTCVAKTLPPEQQAALLLREVYELSNEEGAAALGKTVAVFKHLVHDARATMTSLFERRCALVNKQGVCYQCSELSDNLRGADETRRQRGELELQPQESAEARARTLDLRLRLVRALDPLAAAGTNLHTFLLRMLRAANGLE